MNGKISVNSTYGEGSTFTVTLSQKLDGVDQKNEDISNNNEVEVL